MAGSTTATVRVGVRVGIALAAFTLVDAARVAVLTLGVTLAGSAATAVRVIARVAVALAALTLVGAARIAVLTLSIVLAGSAAATGLALIGHLITKAPLANRLLARRCTRAIVVGLAAVGALALGIAAVEPMGAAVAVALVLGAAITVITFRISQTGRRAFAGLKLGLTDAVTGVHQTADVGIAWTGGGQAGLNGRKGRKRLTALAN